MIPKNPTSRQSFQEVINPRNPKVTKVIGRRGRVTEEIGFDYDTFTLKKQQDVIDKMLLHPNDFEAYFIALELVDAKSETIDYLAFPVNPTSISKVEPVSTNIKKTFGGIVVTKTDEFIPQTITYQGNFGRGFLDVRTNNLFIAVSATERVYDFDYATANKDDYDPKGLKTGFGVMKMMQKICKNSRGYSGNRPHKLYLHNLTFSESYLCEVRSLRFFQTYETNMIWNYELEIDIVEIITLNVRPLFRGLVETAPTFKYNPVAKKLWGQGFIDAMNTAATATNKFLGKGNEWANVAFSTTDRFLEIVRSPLALLNAPLNFSKTLYGDLTRLHFNIYATASAYLNLVDNYTSFVNSLVQEDTGASKFWKNYVGLYHAVIDYFDNYLDHLLDGVKEPESAAWTATYEDVVARQIEYDSVKTEYSQDYHVYIPDENYVSMSEEERIDKITENFRNEVYRQGLLTQIQSNDVVGKYVMLQNQTLEDAIKQFGWNTTPNKPTWKDMGIDVLLENRMLEPDYELNGGDFFLFKKNNPDFPNGEDVKTLVLKNKDYTELYGRDISAEFEFKGLGNKEYKVDVINGFSIGNGYNGSGSYEEGDVIVIYADEPEPDHQFERWNINPLINFIHFTDRTNPIAKFIMPNRDVKVEAVYRIVPNNNRLITITTNDGGTANANVNSAPQGTIISIIAVANDNFKFLKWQVVSGSIALNNTNSSTTFTMPNTPVEIMAIFEELEEEISEAMVYKIHKIDEGYLSSYRNGVETKYSKGWTEVDGTWVKNVNDNVELIPADTKIFNYVTNADIDLSKIISIHILLIKSDKSISRVTIKKRDIQKLESEELIDYDSEGNPLFHVEEHDVMSIKYEGVDIIHMVDINTTDDGKLALTFYLKEPLNLADQFADIVIEYNREYDFVDLRVLEPAKTFIQTINILTNLGKNDNPENPDDGINKGMIQNRMGLYAMLPILKRELAEYISRDDTIKRFNIRSIDFDQDGIFIELEFYSRVQDEPFTDVVSSYDWEFGDWGEDKHEKYWWEV